MGQHELFCQGSVTKPAYEINIKRTFVAIRNFCVLVNWWQTQYYVYISL